MFARLSFTVVFLGLCVRSFHVRQAGKSCSVNGQVVNDGDTFKMSLAGPCVNFVCRDGGVFPHDYGCERDGQCYPEGDTYNIGCIKRQCGPLGGGFGYTRVNEGCSIKGVCLGVNETYKDGCFTYRCTKKGSGFAVTYSLDLVDWGCSRGGKCYPEGQELTVQCLTTRCNRTNDIVGFVTTGQGCDDGVGGCLSVGASVENACRTFQCMKEDLNGVPFYSLNVVKSRCQDSNLDCHDPGSYFSFKMNGTVHKDCTCNVQGTQIQYYC